nr:P27 family phage terminase small subunit [uncultured Bacteroides sp.]
MKKNKLEKETVSYMAAIRTFLIKNFGEINEEWKGSLLILEQNFNLFIKCKNQIEVDGLTVTDRFGALVKHPLIKVMQDANIQVIKLTDLFGLSLKSNQNLSINDKKEDENDVLTQFLKKSIEKR